MISNQTQSGTTAPIKVVFRAFLLSILVAIPGTFLGPLLGFFLLWFNIFNIEPNYLFGTGMIIGVTIPPIIVNLLQTQKLSLNYRIFAIILYVITFPVLLYITTYWLNHGKFWGH